MRSSQPETGLLGRLARMASHVLGIASAPVTVPLSAVARAPRIAARMPAMVAAAPRALVGGVSPRALAGSLLLGTPSREPLRVARISGELDSARVVVFVPGANSAQEIWEQGRELNGGTYPERVGRLLGWGVIELGAGAATVPEGSVALSALLQQLVGQWPVPLERLVLVGYAGGGLFARGAAGMRLGGESAWTDLLTDVICLGTAGYGVTPAGLSGSVGRTLDEQLAGISVVDERVLDTPPADGVDYLLVCDELAARANPLGRAVGQVLWWRHRRSRGRRKGPREVHDLFPTARRFEVSTSQAPMTNHPQVHAALLSWLG